MWVLVMRASFRLTVIAATAFVSACLAGACFAAQHSGDYESLIVRGPWVAEDGRIWTFSTSTIYERDRATNIHRTMPFEMDEADRELRYDVWWAHFGDYARPARGVMGETYDGDYRLDGDLLVVGDRTFRASMPR